MQRSARFLTWLLTFALLLTHALPVHAQDVASQGASNTIFLPLVGGVGETSKPTATSGGTIPARFSPLGADEEAQLADVIVPTATTIVEPVVLPIATPLTFPTTTPNNGTVAGTIPPISQISGASSTATASGPPPFGKVAPSNGTTNAATSITLQWQAALGAAGYGYCIDLTLNNSCDRGIDNYVRTSATSVTLSLAPNQNYEWQVRAYATTGEWTPANGIGEWWRFTTEGTEISGYLPGEFQVSEAGAATYRIPLALPSGTGGMTPHLALTYDSRGGNTISAWGWSLSGLSVINRCSTTLAQNSFIDGVDFDGNDQFCLDGQLLVAVQGIYGADQTVYRTENESFSKVVSYGKSGTGPAGFKVWTKAGLIMEYGLTDNSRLDAQGRADILYWAVGKIQDTKGNYLLFDYNKNVAAGELNPLRIRYTGNSAQQLTPYATVEFIYENRPDGRVQYIAGSAITLAKRLQYLRTYIDSALVREIRFGYETSPTTGRSRLINLTECGWDGQCLPATRFRWSGTSTAELNFTGAGSGAWQGHAGGANNNAIGDFNGDGRTDMAGYTGSNGRWHVCLSTGTNFTCDFWTAHAGGVGNNVTADFNGDGLTDLAGYTGNAGRWHVCLATGSGFNCSYWVGHGGGVRNNVVADFNGDQRTDLAGYTGSNGRWHVCLSTGSGFSCNYWTAHAGGVNNNVTGDFNGDGQTDLIGYTGASGQWHLCFSTGSGFACSYVIAHAGGATNNAAADFNGDGLTDLAGYTGSNGRWHVCLATGSSFACSYWLGHAGGANNNVMADYNGDGMVDLAGYTGSNSQWHVCLSTGTGWDCGRYWAGHGGGSSNNATGDYNGDGKSDLAGYTGSNGVWHVVLAAGSVPDNLQQVTSGHGAQINITYAPLTNPAVYTKASGVTYPQREFIAPMPVVQEYSTSNGLGGFHRMTYRYEGLRIDLQGRGFLGFANIKATDTETGIATITYYHQFHPYKSSVRKVEQFQPDGKLLQRMENTWSVKTFSGRVQAAALTTAEAQGYYSETDQSAPLPVTPMTPSTESTTPLTATAATAEDPASESAIPSLASPVLTMRFYLPLINSGETTAQQATDDLENTMPSFPFQERDYVFTTFIDTGAVAQQGINEQPTVDRQLTNLAAPRIDMMAQESEADALNQITAANTQGVTYFPYISQSVVQKLELNGNLIYSTVTSTAYDHYGNPTILSETASDGYSKHTANTYTNDTTRWILGRLIVAQVAALAPNQATQTRTVAFAYDTTSGLLIREESEPNSSLSLVKSYAYDGFGNIIRSTISGYNLSARSQSTEFDSRGRLLIKSTNALGHSEVRSYNQRLGLPTAITDPNGLTTNRSYDSFGRLAQETRPDGTTSGLSYRLCRSGSCPANAVAYLRTETSGSTPAVAYLDQLDRTIRSETVGFNGQPIYVDTIYNARGQVHKASTPYFSGSTPLWTSYTYDLLGRTTSELEPNQAMSTVVYAGLVTQATNALGQITSRTVNSQGWLLRSVDATGSALVYSYDSFGNLLTLADPAGNTTTMQYDLRGRKVSLRDPDTGLTQYRYNVVDELIWQKDAKNQEVTLLYDNLGRLIERSEWEGTSRWVYDTATKGIGQIAEITGPNGYKERYSYDALSRLTQTTYTIDGQSLFMRNTYDQYSRVDVLAYPTGFAVRHIYNANGYLSEVRDFANNSLFWQANTANARGQLEGETFRNGVKTNRTFDPKTGYLQSLKSGPAIDPTRVQNLGYSFDLLGNLTGRTDNRQGLTELFKYDRLNRLTSAQVNTRAAQTVQYDRLGNITFKSDVGTYRYGENGAGPHAVTSLANGVSTTFTYDANGNRITSTAGTISYASFNLPTSINHNNRTVTFAYGPDHARYKETIQVSGVTTTTLFAGGRYERVTVGSRTVHKHLITGSSGVVAIYYHQPGGPADYVHYLHRDHLGSIDTITDGVGNVVERLSYDPWGKRRTADWQNVNAAITSVVRRGYTGHEQLNEVGLIHMNGRVYDPTIGRFLSADPFVQAPDFTQSLNRYSYVLNNPLTLTDPSGFFSFGKLLKKIGDFFEENWKSLASAVVAIAVTIGTAGWGSGVWGAVFSGAAGGFAGNATGVLLNGGGLPQALQAGLRGAVIGGITAGAFYQVGEHFGHRVEFARAAHVKKIIAHGVVGGASEALQGGKFAHGFLSGAFTQAFAQGIDVIDQSNPGINTYRTLAAAIVGGTAAELGGGKFANGAITGAFSRMFNDDSQKSTWEKVKESVMEVTTIATVTFSESGVDHSGRPTYLGRERVRDLIRMGKPLERLGVIGVVIGSLSLGIDLGSTLTQQADFYAAKFYGRERIDNAWLSARDKFRSLMK